LEVLKASNEHLDSNNADINVKKKYRDWTSLIRCHPSFHVVTMWATINKINERTTIPFEVYVYLKQKRICSSWLTSCMLLFISYSVGITNGMVKQTLSLLTQSTYRISCHCL